MIRRELTTFLVVGITTVALDFLCYSALLQWTTLDSAICKSIGFVTGTAFAYVANRYWTFQSQGPVPSSIGRFAGLYASTLGANVLINHTALHFLEHHRWSTQVAFTIATSVSAVLNFAGMKYLVFKKPPTATAIRT